MKGFTFLAIAIGVVLVASVWAWLATLALKQLVYQEVRRERAEAKWMAGSSGSLIWVMGIFGIASALLAGIVLGRPILGPLFLAVTPWLARRAVRARRDLKRQRLEDEMVTFLHGLKGLTRAGLALPSALFHLSRSLPGELPAVMGHFLRDYERGRSLSHCLERFRSQLGLRASAVPLALLELAYRQGLSIGPVLEQALPRLEEALEARRRSAQLRRAAIGQGCLAALMPWGLLLVLKLFQPDVVDNFLASSLALPVVAGAILWEGVGILVIRRVAC